jgi:hypothetical protein
MKRSILLVSILVLGSIFLIFGLSYWTKYSNQPDRGLTGVEAVSVDSQDAPQSYPTQEISDNGVTIAITPVQLALGNNTTVFAVTLSTHTVDLDYDLVKLATLQIDEGPPLAAISWDGNQGGHHVSGILTFPSVGVAAIHSINIVIREVANVPTWAFAWQLQ